MTNFVFIHGPGAGGCSEGFYHQLRRFPGSVAPDLPGHLSGEPCANVKEYTDWLRGWLQDQDKRQDLFLCGFTLGACIALQYALDYPEEVKALALMTVAMRPKERRRGTYEMRLRAAKEPDALDKWLDTMRHMMKFVEPEMRGQLMQRHAEVGPISQYHDLVVIDEFDVRDRIASLKPPLLLIRGVDDPGSPPEYEREIHKAVRGSRYLKLKRAGHFPMVERPEEVNRAIEEFLRKLD